MTEKRPLPPDDRDFDAIEAAVMETERGRWFLAEFAKRNRLGETRLLLDAITRLEQNIGGPSPSGDSDVVRAAIATMAERLSRAALSLGGRDDLATAMNGFVQAAGRMEAATSDIHDAAERVSEIAWRLREAGASPAICGELENAAADISTACAFGGLTAQRAAALGTALRDLAQILDSLPPAWRPRGQPTPPISAPPAAALALNAPAPPARGDAPQRKIPVAKTAAAATPQAAVSPAVRPQSPSAETESRPKPAPSPMRMPVPSLAAIEKLDFRERLKLFT